MDLRDIEKLSILQSELLKLADNLDRLDVLLSVSFHSSLEDASEYVIYLEAWKEGLEQKTTDILAQILELN